MNLENFPLFLSNQSLIERELCRKEFSFFVKQAWPYVEPGVQLIWNWHLDVICDHLQAAAEGKIKRLIINIPYRCSKSTICSILFPAWVWLQQPRKKFITTSYDESLALRDSYKMRNLVQTDFYIRLADPGFGLATDQAQKRYYVNSFDGHRLARGITSGATGHTAEILLADDPMSAKIVGSEAEREEIITSFNDQFMTRLTPPGQGVAIIVMQRFHHRDLSGVFLDDDAWDKLIIPVEWDGNHRSKTQLGWRDPRTELGELMFPEYFTREVVDELKEKRGPHFYASQLQQNPVPAEGSIIKTDWIKFYKHLPHIKRYVWSWDTAFKAGTMNDFSVGTCWGEAEDGFYLVDMFRQKVEYTPLKQVMKSSGERIPPFEVLVEDKGSGQSLVQDLRRETRLPIIPVIPGRDMPLKKDERLNYVAGLFEAGKVKIPEGAPWAYDFIKELTEFGACPHDDIVDSVTQYLARVNKRGTSTNLSRAFLIQ